LNAFALSVDFYFYFFGESLSHFFYFVSFWIGSNTTPIPVESLVKAKNLIQKSKIISKNWQWNRTSWLDTIMAKGILGTAWFISMGEKLVCNTLGLISPRLFAIPQCTIMYYYI
jgi:hypothetical protein